MTHSSSDFIRNLLMVAAAQLIAAPLNQWFFPPELSLGFWIWLSKIQKQRYMKLTGLKGQTVKINKISHSKINLCISLLLLLIFRPEGQQFPTKKMRFSVAPATGEFIA